jgi:transposase InsO family protein
LEAKSARENFIPTESRLIALERAKEEKEAHGEIETEHPGYLGAQDTCYVGNIKGVGHICQQTFIDTYTKVAFCKPYDRRNALAAADMLNDKVIPFFDSQGIPLLRVLTDRGSEYCGNREHHEYALYLDIENIEHTKTKAKSPQTDGICGRFNKTCKDEFYSIAFRKKVYRGIDEIQFDLDAWIREYNHERTHSGKYCYGKTPMQTFSDSIPLAEEKLIGYDISDGQSA